MYRKEYDVVICGGGIAGQTLARQLKLNIPDINILLLERNAFPVTEAAHKVGESTIEVAANYLSQDLQLEEYLKENHLTKLGLRFFWKDHSIEKEFYKRSEFGLSEFPIINSYQLDIGRLENDLWKMNRSSGIQVVDKVSVKDIVIHKNPAPSTVGNQGFHYKLNNVVFQKYGEDQTHQVKSAWVIDAMGRRRFLQNKFGLGKTCDKPVHSSVWFRVKGRINVAALVPDSQVEWHNRVPNDKRWHSTIHLLGKGYWVWLIPLASGNTSVGIVATEEEHPFKTYNTQELALTWLDKYEHTISRYIQEFEIIDFLKMRDYAFSSEKIFSEEKWASIGNSAIFTDPLFSPGSVIISRQNNFLTKMISLDKRNMLPPGMVEKYNDAVLNMNKGIEDYLYGIYKYLDNRLVFATSAIFGNMINWGINTPLKIHSIYLDDEMNHQVQGILGNTYRLINVFDMLMLDWREITKNRIDFDFIDYHKLPFMKKIAALQSRKSPSAKKIQADFRWMADQLEELAQVIFLLVVEDCLPEKLIEFENVRWINAWAISVHPERWENDGLFRPMTSPRDLTETKKQLRSLYKFSV